MAEDPAIRRLQDYGRWLEDRTGLELSRDAEDLDRADPSPATSRKGSTGANGHAPERTPPMLRLDDVAGRPSRRRAPTLVVRGVLLGAAAAVIAFAIAAGVGRDDPSRVEMTGAGPTLAGEELPLDADLPLGADPGELQVTLQWTGPGDLDLVVVEPNDDRVGTPGRFDAMSPTASGGLLTDAHDGACGDTDLSPRFEHAAWPTAPPPSGLYRVGAMVALTCGEPIQWRIDVRLDDRLVASDAGTFYSFDGERERGTETGGHLTFVIPPSA